MGAKTPRPHPLDHHDFDADREQADRLLAKEVITPEEHWQKLVEIAVAEIHHGNTKLQEAVGQAREAGFTWKEIGEYFNISPQAAYQRFDPVGISKHRERQRRQRAGRHPAGAEPPIEAQEMIAQAKKRATRR